MPRRHGAGCTFADTNWSSIVANYEELAALTDSPIAKLNLAIALGYAGSPSRGLALAESLTELPAFRQSHFAAASIAHLHAMLGNREAAEHHAEIAAHRGGTQLETEIMRQQIARLLDKSE